MSDANATAQSASTVDVGAHCITYFAAHQALRVAWASLNGRRPALGPEEKLGVIEILEGIVTDYFARREAEMTDLPIAMFEEFVKRADVVPEKARNGKRARSATDDGRR